MKSSTKNIVWTLCLIFPSLFVVLSLSAQTDIDTSAVRLLPAHDTTNFGNSLEIKLRQDIVRPEFSEDWAIKISNPFHYERNQSSYINPMIPFDTEFMKNVYHDYSNYPVGNDGVFYMNNLYDIMPGMSSMNSISAGFKIQPTENWYINLGSSAYQYRDFSGIYNDFTIDASSYISISDNLGLNLYGRYSVNGRNNADAGSVMNSPFAPSSFYGGSIEFRITDKFGIEAGVLREYNVWRRRWENVYFAAPKFYK